MASKYGNIKTTVYGVHFDSRAESRRYLQLLSMQDAGEISGLILQPEYELIPAFTDNTGKRQARTVYRGDFEYVENGRRICDDVKGGPITSTFALKAKLFKLKYRDIELRIVRM